MKTLAEAFRELPYPTPPSQVSEKRTRQAVDRLVTLQFDRNGGRSWDEAKALLDHEHARMRIGQVAVPFRADPSYLPDLRTYLDTQLRDRKRLAAADELNPWARAEAQHHPRRRSAACGA
ncbi:hypothetical protein ACFWAR_00380 [Streptomyces sp. NPDC059917]|uniref:hypothetical protein n=1 Tax=Streptomyces sp. NPDC059917 TaxID=3347002 RepID=UPI0036695C9D